MKWISVKDRLPNNDQEAYDSYYLVYGKEIGDQWDTPRKEGFNVMPANWSHGSFSSVDYPAHLKIEVTHWIGCADIPLPENLKP